MDIVRTACLDAAGVTHGAVCPVDVVKTRMQLEPEKYNPPPRPTPFGHYGMRESAPDSVGAKHSAPWALAAAQPLFHNVSHTFWRPDLV